MCVCVCVCVSVCVCVWCVCVCVCVNMCSLVEHVPFDLVPCMFPVEHDHNSCHPTTV